MTVALDRALPAADAGGMADGKADPDPEVPERARRRTFTAKYKLEMRAAAQDPSRPPACGPPPGRQARPSGSSPESSSAAPCATVASRTPAARATSRIPP
jgi:hypothetical protein